MFDEITKARAELLRLLRDAPGYPAVERLYEAFHSALNALEKRILDLEAGKDAKKK